jgi:hypothetical protein
MPTTVPGMSRSVSGVPAFIDPRAGRADLAPSKPCPGSKTDFHSPAEARQKMIKTHINNVCGLTKIDQTFASAAFHRFLP